MTSRRTHLKGQYSTFIKPITVLIFGGLLVSLLVSSLNFDIGLSSEREQTRFQSSPSVIYSDLTECLSGENTNSINKTYLKELEKSKKLSQLDCVKNYGAGYSVSVKQDRPENIAPKDPGRPPTEIVFALDDSASTQPYINATKDNLLKFKSNIGDPSFGITTYTDEESAEVEIQTQSGDTTIKSKEGEVTIDQNIVAYTQDVETTLDSITASLGGFPQEAVFHAIKKSIDRDKMNWSKETNKVIILTNTDGAHDGNRVLNDQNEITTHYDNLWNSYNVNKVVVEPYDKNCADLQDLADKADDRGIAIYTLFKNDVSDMADVDGCSQEITEDIPDETGGESYDITESFNRILSDVASDLFKDRIRYDGDSTCGVPKVNSYKGSAELVVTSDISQGFGGEWQTICQELNRTVRKLESRGLDTGISYYAPSNPDNRDADSGLGGPAEIVNSTGQSENYSYKSNPVPSCLSYPENNASTGSYGKGITDWNQTEIVEYNESIDSGLEAWGVSSRWILKNHDWNQSADKRALFVVGNQLPFGGNSSEKSYRKEDNPNKLDGEKELAENIAALALDKNVEINAIGGQFEHKGESNYREPEENDAAELMEYVSTETGGSFLRYDGIGEIPRKIARQFTDISSGVIAGGSCKNVGYEFGQTKGSTEEDLDRTLSATYPGTLLEEDGSQTGATVRINMKMGALERLAGAVNRATDTGKNLDQQTSGSIRVNNQKTITVRNKTIYKDKNTMYTLQKPDGDKTVKVDDDLVIGIDGQPVFKDFNKAETTIDFAKPENQFESYEGASIQLIASTGSQSQELPELELTCANFNCGLNQTLNSEEINASEGDRAFLRNGERGIYYTNFTDIQMGRQYTNTSELMCYQGTQKCVNLEAEKSENLTLRPGNNEVNIEYNQSYGVKFK
jgi:hypothetical protein